MAPVSAISTRLTVVLQVGQRDRAVVGKVLRQKNTQRWQRRLGAPADQHGRAPRSPGPDLERHGERKYAALLDCALTQMRPPINSTRRFEIVRPNPEPPNLQVVESARLRRNRSNTRLNFSSEMPMPVSDRNRNAVGTENLHPTLISWTLRRRRIP